MLNFVHRHIHTYRSYTIIVSWETCTNLIIHVHEFNKIFSIYKTC